MPHFNNSTTFTIKNQGVKMHNNGLYFCAIPCRIPSYSAKSMQKRKKKSISKEKSCPRTEDRCAFVLKNIFV